MVINDRYIDDTILLATGSKDLQELLIVVIENKQRQGF